MSFSNTVFGITDNYTRQNVAFSIGDVFNNVGENSGSADIFSFALMAELDKNQTLELFGEHYKNVLDNPDGENHQNIRAFMEYGLDGLDFPDGYSLVERDASLSSLIDVMWEQRGSIKQGDKFEGRKAVIEVFHQIEMGKLGPVAVDPYILSTANSLKEVEMGINVYEWVKKALLLGLSKLFSKREIQGVYSDVLPCNGMGFDEFENLPISTSPLRMVPPGVRRGAKITNIAMMPNTWVNSGAVIGEGTMLDTGSTAGSCSYIGKNCHISGKAGTGGVFEPLGAIPVVLGDNVFVGICSEPTEGVIVGSGAVIAPGVILTQSVRIYDNRKDSPTKGEFWYGFVPHDSLVVTGTYQNESGSNISCAYIVKDIDPTKRGKVDINNELRNL